MKGLVARLVRFWAFLDNDLWVMDFSALPPVKARLLKVVKVLAIVARDFVRDRCPLRAQALTYSSLLAIVPLFAVVFSVLKGFGFQNWLGEMLLSKITNFRGVVERIIEFINNTSVQTLGAVGGAALLYTAVSLFSGIESTFNDIWHIRTPRPFLRKLTDYLFIVMVVPIFATVVLTVAAGNILGAPFAQRILAVPILRTFIYGIYPYVASWVVLWLLYMVLINTRVRWDAALIGGVVAGTVMQWAQIVYLDFATGVNRYNIIFGSFAQPILAFIWLNVVWNIILAGAELVYAIQNVDIYQPEGKRTGLAVATKDRLALLVLRAVLRPFLEGGTPAGSDDIVAATRLPVKVVNDTLAELLETGLLVEGMHAETRKPVYTPAVAPDRLTVALVLDRLRKAGTAEVRSGFQAAEKPVRSVMARLDRMLEREFGRLRVADL